MATRKYKVYSNGIYCGIFTQVQIVRMTNTARDTVIKYADNGKEIKGRWRLEEIPTISTRHDTNEKRKLLQEYEWDKYRMIIRKKMGWSIC